jgi:putative oxidoreductase
LLRLVVGGFFVGHGTQKLFGWFGGAGLEATASGFEQLGLRPGRRNAVAAGISEAGGGAAIALGLATPAAAAALIGVMLTAIRTVHLKNGPWAADGGYEYNAVLVAALAALAGAGPGALSLDARLGTEVHGDRWALAALAGGAVGAAGTHLVATRQNT